MYRQYLWAALLILSISSQIYGETLSTTTTVIELITTTQEPSAETSTPSTTPVSPPTTTTTTPAPKSKSRKNGKSSDKVVKDCPEECVCVEKRSLNCQGKKLKEQPALRSTAFTEVYLSDNNLDELDFGQLPPFVELLDLSRNQIKSFTSSLRRPDALNKLKILNLSNNALEHLESFNDFKLNNLEVLDLSNNKLNNLENGLVNVKNLQSLGLRDTGLSVLVDADFSNLPQLKTLNMTSITAKFQPRQFYNNKKLEAVDLTNCSLLELPIALRDIPSLKRITLNSNNMTSLRQSDFLGMSSLVYIEIRKCPRLSKIDEYTFSELENLKTLILSDNPKLQSVSQEAFPIKQGQLQVVDLRNNNLSTLGHPRLDLSKVTLKLDKNVWNCDCDLKWLDNVAIARRPLMHCKTPSQFKGLEISSFLSMTDCEIEESGYHTLILIGFLLFLFGLLVAVVVQKTDIFRRFLWKDQYGTIYYTKASFPTSETI